MWEYRAAIVSVIDGDTIRVLADTGFSGRHEVDLRLLRVLAPELDEPNGLEVRNFVTGWIYSLPSLRWPLHIETSVTTVPEPTEKRSFIRYLAEVKSISNGASLNDAILNYLRTL